MCIRDSTYTYQTKKKKKFPMTTDQKHIKEEGGGQKRKNIVISEFSEYIKKGINPGTKRGKTLIDKRNPVRRKYPCPD